MEISSHYLPYKNKTVIALTNNECAKLLFIFNRELTESETLSVDHRGKRSPDPSLLSLQEDSDEFKAHVRKELFSKLSRKLARLLKADIQEVILCAPEVNKNELLESMHTDVMRAVVEVVPKNLASLPLDHVVRILQETRTV